MFIHNTLTVICCMLLIASCGPGAVATQTDVNQETSAVQDRPSTPINQQPQGSLQSQALAVPSLLGTDIDQVVAHLPDPQPVAMGSAANEQASPNTPHRAADLIGPLANRLVDLIDPLANREARFRRAVDFVMSRIRFIVPASSQELDELRVRLIVRELVAFLIDQFGPPPKESFTVQLEIGESETRHAFITFRSRAARSIRIAKANFYGSQRMYIVHELFHGFYHTDTWLNEPISVLEGWATYAQYRYFYRGCSNSDIRATLMQIFAIHEDDLAHDLAEVPWSTLEPREEIRNYIVSSLRLFSRSHEQNLVEYLTLSYTQ